MTDKQKKHPPKIAFIGGDLRQIEAARALREKGYPVSLYGFDAYNEKDSLPFADAVKDASVWVLPIPVLRGDTVNLPFSKEKLSVETLVDALRTYSPAYLFGGGLPAALLTLGKSKIHDFLSDDGFNTYNAVPTAEGALALAIGHTDRTLHSASVAVVGYGKIGRALARSLVALGAEVTVVARRTEARIEAELCGCRAIPFEEAVEAAPKWEVVFNTVPYPVLDGTVLERMRPQVCLIELASRPYGIVGSEALRLGLAVLHAPSLPGKTAPRTAGEILARCLTLRLKEEDPT